MRRECRDEKPLAPARRGTAKHEDAGRGLEEYARVDAAADGSGFEPGFGGPGTSDDAVLAGRDLSNGAIGVVDHWSIMAKGYDTTVRTRKSRG